MSPDPDINPASPYSDPSGHGDRASDLAELGALAPLYAHEMNNLMTHLSGRAQLALLRPNDPEITRSVMRSIVEGCERAARLSELFLSNASRHEDQQRTNLNDVFARIQRSFQLEPNASTLISFDQDESNHTVDVPPIIIEQILDNLIRNALRAVDEHPEPNRSDHKIEIRVVPSDSSCSTWNTPTSLPPGIEIHVIDTGIGMSPSQIESVLSPTNSTRAARTHNVRFPRHGLGMRVCLMLVESVGGTIQCESEPSRGTRMIVSLPSTDRGEVQTKRAA